MKNKFWRAIFVVTFFMETTLGSDSREMQLQSAAKQLGALREKLESRQGAEPSLPQYIKHRIQGLEKVLTAAGWSSSGQLQPRDPLSLWLSQKER